MKNLLLIATLVLISAVSIIGQERPRDYDNFDTSRGVTIVSSQASEARSPTANPTTSVRRMATLAPNLIKKTAQVTMTVYDGLAQREAPTNPVAVPLAMGGGSRLRGYSTGNAMVDSYIVDSSRRYNIDPLLIYAQMNQESSFKPRARSHKGASGLMQLMPPTARRMGVTDIWDPQQNIEGGVKYMRMLLNMFDGDVSLALAGYNAGEGAVLKYGRQIPPYRETIDYVRRISDRYSSITRQNDVKSVHPF